MSGVIVRKELVGASLKLGGAPIELSDYAATGLRMVAMGPSGSGKTNAGLLVCEQLVAMGWVAVLVDPEGEIRSLYGDPVSCPEELAVRLKARKDAFLVIDAPDAEAFVPYGKAISSVCDAERKPVIVMMDEGQLFSSPRTGRRRKGVTEATDIINDIIERGRKRSLDVIFTAHRFTSSINRSIFGNMNLTLIGAQTDPTVWAQLSPQFRAHRVTYSDLTSLSTGEFYCLSRRGLDKFQLPLAKALGDVALNAKPRRNLLPTNFSQWDRAMTAMGSARLEALTDDVVDFLAGLSGLTSAQIGAGRRTLTEERATR